MVVKASGRFVPPSAFAAGTGKTFTGAYAWNAPREAVGRERPLTRDASRHVLALPSLLLALVLVAIFGPSIGNAALALTFVALPHYVRLTRAAVLVEVNRDYVTASRVAFIVC